MCSCVEATNKKTVGIIGCGASGLAALKNFTEEGSQFNCVAFEQTDSIGGTWVYTDDIDRDQYGLPVHSSMYKTLRYLCGLMYFLFILLIIMTVLCLLIRTLINQLVLGQICLKKSWSLVDFLIKELATHAIFLLHTS